MKIDISFLPAYAAAFMLVFARIGTMVMLLPGLGEMSVPRRVRLSLALVLAAVLLPLHRSAYEVDLRSFGPVLDMLGQEVFIGAVLGITARLMISALQVAGFVIAQQLGLGFVTAVDPTPGPAGRAGRQLPDHPRRHHDLRRRSASPGDRRAQRQLCAVPARRDSAAWRRRGADHADHRDRVQDRHPACGAVPGVRAPVQSRARRACRG